MKFSLVASTIGCSRSCSLRHTEGFGMNDDLMLRINDCYPVIALDYAMEGLHLRALVFGDSVFRGLPRLPGLSPWCQERGEVEGEMR